MKTKRDKFCDWCRQQAVDPDEVRKIAPLFAAEVNRRAEAKMLLTHKLEGSHKAAIDELLKEWGLK